MCNNGGEASNVKMVATSIGIKLIPTRDLFEGDPILLNYGMNKVSDICRTFGFVFPGGEIDLGRGDLLDCLIEEVNAADQLCDSEEGTQIEDISAARKLAKDYRKIRGNAIRKLISEKER